MTAVELQAVIDDLDQQILVKLRELLGAIHEQQNTPQDSGAKQC
jgi:hypothetical protein